MSKTTEHPFALSVKAPAVALVVSAIAFALSPVRSAAASDPDAWIAQAAKYESGMSAEPLREIERLLCESVGKPDRRAELEGALIRLLAPETPFEAKRFACKHLAVHGSESALPALAGLLKHDETAGIACLALGRLPSAKAGDLLRTALSEAQGLSRLQLVSALGHRAEPASVKPLSGLCHDADAALASAAIRALGAIDAAPARAAVAALRKEARPAVALAVAAATLNGAQQLEASGNTAAASAICEELVRPAFPQHIRRGAFGMVLRCDADGGAQRIRKTLKASPADAVLNAVAIARIPELRGEGVSKSFGKMLPRLPPSEQALLLGALTLRADADARAVIRSQVGADVPAVRCAAIAAVGALEDEAAVALLTRALMAAPTPEEVKAVQLAMAGLGGNEATDRAIVEALHQAAAADKPRLMAVLSRRGGRTAVSVLLALSKDSDERVARAAAQALVRLADLGDSASLAELQTAVAGRDARIRETALRTLIAWRGAAAWETLAGVYAKPENPAQHTLALRGLIRIAGEGNAHPDAALIGRYRHMLTGARDDADRKLILRALAGAGHPDALALALPLADLPGVRAEAVQAVEQIAKMIEKSHPKAVEEALKKVKRENT